MRDVIFRGRAIETGVWVYGYLFKDDFKSYIIEPVVVLDDFPCFVEVEDDTVGQCTNFRDKSNKLIFEKDLLQIFKSDQKKIYFGSVYWNEDEGAFGVHLYDYHQSESKVGDIPLANLRDFNVYVIGNIFDD